MILDKEVEVGISWKNSQYYRDLGYEIPTYINKNTKQESIKKGTKILVKVEDLKRHSHEKVHVACDKCGKEAYITYQSYCNKIEEFGDYTCIECKGDHYKRHMMEKYGVENVSQLPEIKEKKRQSSLEKYGTECTLQSEEVKQKIYQTNHERYGCKTPMQNEEIKKKAKKTLEEKHGSLEQFFEHRNELAKETNLKKYGVEKPSTLDSVKQKAKNTNLEKYNAISPMCTEEVQKKARETTLKHYGVEHPAQSREIQEKIKRSCLENLGYEYPMQSPEVLGKAKKTLYENNSVPVSRQQQYICELYDGLLNYPFMAYNLDIFKPEDNIVIEYSGGGHDLSVKLGSITQEEFDKKELIRKSYISRAGYRLIEIVSPDDRIPSDEKLIEMYSFAKDYFNTTNHTWMTYYTKDNKYRNAENMTDDGSHYDFGELRIITEKDMVNRGCA